MTIESSKPVAAMWQCLGQAEGRRRQGRWHNATRFGLRTMARHFFVRRFCTKWCGIPEPFLLVCFWRRTDTKSRSRDGTQSVEGPVTVEAQTSSGFA